MAVRFAVRGSAYDARYSTGYPQGTAYNSGQISIAAGDITSVIDLSNTAVVKYLGYSMVKNSSTTRTFSLLLRFAPTYTGAPAATRALFEMNTGASASGAFIVVAHAVTTGNLIITARNQAGASVFSSANFGAWSPTANQYYDLVIQGDGTTGANAYKAYFDNTLLGQLTASAAYDTNWNEDWWKTLAIGAATSITTSAMKVSEIVLFDSLVGGTSVTLTSGSGTLNGSSRTAFVDAAAFDGSSSTDPGVANVLSTASYTIRGNALTGTYVAAATGNVKTGVTYGAASALTGTYDGSDRWTDPGDSNVRLATAYKANSTSNNKTGRVTVPTAGNVKTGVTFETDAGTTGTYDGSDRWTDPGVSNVKSGTTYTANNVSKTGTLVGGKGHLGPGRIG